MTAHRFVSWVRCGIAATRTSSTVSGAHPTVQMRVSVNGTGHDLPVSLHGPGDIAGLAATAIVRRDPAPNSLGVSPHGIPFVELRPADLPWRFSPAPTADAPAKSVLPWIALVVVPAAAPFGPRSGAPLPVLSASRKDLPDPSELWAWTHVQVDEPEGGIAGPVAAYVQQHGDRAVARLLAPRRLAAGTDYRACLVPVYEAGRRAGLGRDDIAGAGVALAWNTAGDPDEAIELPVYDTWLIHTGAVADFESIARRLRGRDPDQLFTPIDLDVAAAAARTEPLAATMYGLLRPPNGETTLPEAATIAATLRPWLTPDDAPEPAIGPPLYGAAQTAAVEVAHAAAWQKTLNLDPRRRAQAAAGAAVVRADQEQLVADAYTALGQVDRANTMVRGTQLATLLADRLRTRHIAPRPANRIVSMLWPTLSDTQVATAAAPSAAAAGLLSARMRRVVRPAGPVSRGRPAGLSWSRLGRDISLTTKPVALAPGSAVTHASLRAAPAHSGHTMARAVLAPARVTEIRTGLAARRATAIRTIRLPAPKPLDVATLAAHALAASAPIGIARRLVARVDGFTPIATVGQLVEVRPALDLSRPMSDRLATLLPELFAPGLAELPPDTVSVLTVDPAAVEAILAGANDELARELSWRGIPIDRRVTLLRQLWARPARDPRGHDVPPIASWSGELGSHVTSTPTVFLIRSELVRRFPTALFSCVRAVTDASLGRKVGEEHLLPLFRGLAAPDLAYVGVAKSLDELAGAPDWKPGSSADPGWYLTIQERPGHIRFGLDAEPRTGTPTWTNLSWDEVTDPGNPYVRLGHPPQRHYPATPAWRKSAASMAAITERPAVRIAIHVQELLAHG